VPVLVLLGTLDGSQRYSIRAILAAINRIFTGQLERRVSFEGVSAGVLEGPVRFEPTTPEL
jgi:hypothetical protein